MPYTRHFAVAAVTIVCTLPATSIAQLILNEGNSVSSTEGAGFLSNDLSKPYEGYDYGALAHSGNTNLPNNSVSPGNPFSPDLSVAAGTQTAFIDGFDISTNPRGFGRIKYNGGNWIELVVTEDHADLRGFTFYWQDNFDDDGTRGEIRSQDPSLPENERGAVTFTQDVAWANLRAGTIITISDQAFADEVRDDYPYGFPNSGLDDTGHDYDLSTDLSFEPFDSNSDWHIHFYLDETITLSEMPADTQYFAANSDLEVSNEQWAGKILGPTNNVIQSVQNPSLTVIEMDVNTDERTEFVGEAASGVSPNFGAATGATGVGDDEAFALLSNPDSNETGAAYFEDVDWSTFGMPNLFNRRNDVNDTDGDNHTDGDIVSGALEDDDTLSQVQDFSGLYDTVQSITYDWIAGSSNVSAPESWELANDNSTPTASPAADWSMRLINATGSDEIAEVSSDTAASFVELSATDGTMTLDVQAGATLTVDGGFHPGRVLVSEGGVLAGNGAIAASTVELFDGSTQPEASAVALEITGNYIQHSSAQLVIVVGGFDTGDFGALSVLGDAILDGELHISLADGFVPTGLATIEVLSASSLVQSLTLTGDTTGFSLVDNGNSLSLSFQGELLAGDYNGDGMVNLADYTVWRDALGQAGIGLAADGDGNNLVDAGDYLVWKNHFGQSSADTIAAGVATVPEPASLAIASLCLAAALRRRKA